MLAVCTLIAFGWPWPLSSLLAYRAALALNAAGGIKQGHLL